MLCKLLKAAAKFDAKTNYTVYLKPQSHRACVGVAIALGLISFETSLGPL